MNTVVLKKIMFNHKTISYLDNEKKKKVFRCPDCPMKYDSKVRLYSHVEEKHSDLIPEGIGVDQYVFNRKYNKEYQLCVICKQNKTEWNKEKGRYERYCSDACKAKARAEWEKNFKRKHGTINPMEDPDYQRKLQEGRSISKPYIFPDGVKITCMGTYEWDFIDYCVKQKNFTSTDIVNCPEVFRYEYEGAIHIYMPDFYMPEFNLIIEIKDGGDNPNMHHKIQSVDKVKEVLKDQAVIDSKNFNYIKVVNKEYKEFDKTLEYFRNRDVQDNPETKFIIVIPEGKTAQSNV